MRITTPFRGSLFANDFLCESIIESPDWQALDDSALDTFKASVREVFDRFPTMQTPNESQTEDDLIWPVLLRLGWKESLRQQNLSDHGRTDVPDGLLFADAAAKDLANGFNEASKRYEFGLAVVESKRWLRRLDRRSGRLGEETAPSTQMLRYLRRVDDLTTGKLRWGILTNGARWRLYYQGARSVSEQFFEVDLAAIFDLPGHDEVWLPSPKPSGAIGSRCSCSSSDKRLLSLERPIRARSTSAPSMRAGSTKNASPTRFPAGSSTGYSRGLPAPSLPPRPRLRCRKCAKPH